MRIGRTMTSSLRSSRRRQLLKTITQLAAAAPTETGMGGQPLGLTDLRRTIGSTARLDDLLDLMCAIGAVQIEPGGDAIRIPTFVAGLFFQLLDALGRRGEPLTIDWAAIGVTESSCHGLGRGVDLVAAIERHRLATTSDPTPLREVHAAVGLIGGRGPSGERALLFHWDQNAGHWQLVGGRYEERDGSLQATLLREIAEELGCRELSEGVDLRLREIGPPFAEQWVSPTFGVLTRTIFQAFEVQFLSDLPPLTATARWMTESEILAGLTSDRQPISSAPVTRLIGEQRFDLAIFIP